MDLRLAGKRALVTGGSRGIGRAICAALVADGARVVTCARHADGIEQLRADLGPSVSGTALDVRDAAAFEAWVASAAAEFGEIDIVISNVSTRVDPKSASWWPDTFEADLMQHVRLKTAAAPHLAAGGSLTIIASIASVLATVPPYEEAYGAMKAALVNLVAQWAQALGPKGIRVNALSPGPIDFPGGWWDLVKAQNPQAHARAAAMAALGRLGTPEEVAAAAVFLASPAASFVTGANLRIDGGLLKAANF